jgi:hypothetical protein
VLKGKPGQPVKDIRTVRRQTLKAANLWTGCSTTCAAPPCALSSAPGCPGGRHEGLGHKTRSMLDRYNIIAKEEIAQAFQQADRYLSLHPTDRNVTVLASPAEKRASSRTVGSQAARNELSGL